MATESPGGASPKTDANTVSRAGCYTLDVINDIVADRRVDIVSVNPYGLAGGRKIMDNQSLYG
jgi:hypothetical protein